MTFSDLDKQLFVAVEERCEWRALGAVVNMEPGFSVFISNDLF